MAGIKRVTRGINRGLGRANLKLIRRTDADQLSQSHARYQQLLHRLHVEEALLFQPSFSPLPPPPGAADYLRPDNPRLRELVARYRRCHHPVLEHSLWTDDYITSEVDLQFFRGDLAYVWQYRDLNTELHYFLTLQYLRGLDELGLLDHLSEDGLFGAHTVSLAGTIVSRDLLDSLNEIYFLERALGLSKRTGFNIIDIGAGYGRLAHRLARALPDLGHIFCVDAVAVSSFLCEYYLRFRGVEHQASVVPFDELDALLAREPIDLAVNIHSFSECTLASIAAWVDLLAAHDVRYLMVAPNPGLDRGAQLLSHERPVPDATVERLNFLPVIVARGYELVAREPKYRDELVQRHGLSPTHYYLFERTRSCAPGS